MSVMGKDEILKMVRERAIKVEPFNENNAGPASIDLTLGNEFRVFRKGKPIVADENINQKNYTKLVKADKITLKPKEFIHGITLERITLPENICGFLYGRSKFARLGIMIHATASFIQPGICNKQVLEICNLSNRAIVLKKGLKLCQLILMDMKGKGKYAGGFAKQEGL